MPRLRQGAAERPAPMTIEGPPPPLLTPEEAARTLGIGEDTLREMRRSGELPYINIGRGKKRETPRYDLEDLLAWKSRRKKVACPSSSERKHATASIPTTSSSVVADFRAALEKRRSAKHSL
ncbi:helix-turn-helix domain-containing protein [Mesorhizobium sp. NBSH29]|uniref:helix-turn-helix domain-containing protein n=1 Tax=Mesorhizobium sp. NBSH29 TaxID=2654249 RepID=UPI0018BF9A36|nr:helix-turn-helix domain-containing protein [Mesorhizobium sp. NBSH29]